MNETSAGWPDQGSVPAGWDPNATDPRNVPPGFDPGPVPGDTDEAPPLPAAAAAVPAIGVPSSAVGHAPVTVVDPPAGYTAEDIARAWVTHLKGVAAAFRGVLAVLPHGDVIKVLAEAGQLVEAISRGL